jgi:uncharacterized protein
MTTQVEQLRKAVAADDVDAVRRLALDDPTLAMAENDDGMSILLRAQYDDQASIVEALLAGETPTGVFEAAALGQAERMRVLLRERPELVGVFAADGFTPLHVAAHFCNPEVVSLLLDHGADPAAVTRNEIAVTPLHSGVAARRGDHAAMLDIVRMLLEAGAPVDGAQNGGFTALHTAARRGDEELVRVLLAHGADPNVTDDRRADARDHARKRGHEQLLKLLGG